MARIHACDHAGRLISGERWVNIPEPSPFPHETRYYDVEDRNRRRLRECLALKRRGYEYALMEVGENLVVLVPLYKLAD